MTGGNFTVWLIAYDSVGQNELSNYLWVNVTPAAVNLAVIPPAEFVATPGGVNVTLRAAVWGGAPPYQYRWDFGDGGTSTETEPTHTYPGPGIYTVTLTVTDSQGRAATYTMALTIPNRTTVPPADLTVGWVAIGAAAGGIAVGIGVHTWWIRRGDRRRPPLP